MSKLELATDRLRLLALTPDQLGLYCHQPKRLEEQLGFPVSRAMCSERVERAINIKRNRMENVAEKDHPWFTYWLIVVQDPLFGAGLAGFKGAPDSQGVVEIGYGIDPDCQGKGYMTETVKALVDWAFQSDACKAVVAETHKNNAPSIRVLEKAGFERISQSAVSYYWRIEPKR